MSPFPAVLIGGPPDSGKSVLAYSLTRALRQARIAHYVLRANPDGEGDWANEADQVLVRMIRNRGSFTPAFIDTVVGYLRKRHLPLLVDAGGKPKWWQEGIFAQCTHAILLVADRAEDPAAYGGDMTAWQTLMARYGIPVIAHLQSNLQGHNVLLANRPQIIGSISGLRRGSIAGGPTFDALVEKLSGLLAYSEAEVAAVHLAQAPAEITLDLPALARTLGFDPDRWQPEQLPALCDYLPARAPLAIYGRSANWVYATLAMLAYPAPVWLFDARLGWIRPPALPMHDPRVTGSSLPVAQRGWHVALHQHAGFARLEIETEAQYLDYDEPSTLPLLTPPTPGGLVISGRLPHWLLMAAVRQLAPFGRWLAVYQPPLKGAVVIYSREADHPVGYVVRLERNSRARN